MIKYFISFIKTYQHSNGNNVDTTAYNNKIIKFKKESIETILKYLYTTEYSKHIILMKEINYLIHYTFEVLQDDFFKGDKVLQKNITKIDDYLFSQYRKNPKLEFNIRKLLTLASSNRFDEDLKKNLLNYFVFIEETGFELIMLLEDFYSVLDKSYKLNKFDLSNTFQITKKYLKKDSKKNSKDDQTKYQTLLTEKITDIMYPVKIQGKITQH